MKEKTVSAFNNKWALLFSGVLTLLKLCGMPGFVEFVLVRFSHFYIVIAYSNFTFCGT